MNSLWQQCTAQLKLELTPQQYKAWISSLNWVSYDAESNTIIVSAPSRIKAESCAKQYGDKIQNILQSLYEQPVKLMFEVHQKKSSTSQAKSTGQPPSTSSRPLQKKSAHPLLAHTEAIGSGSDFSSDSRSDLSPNLDAIGSADLQHTHNIGNTRPSNATPAAPQANEQPTEAAPEIPPPADAKVFIQAHLDTELNFENLVTGNANHIAKMVAMELTTQLGKKYNPFFIYGGVGVGKTHLMHAIGNVVLKNKPTAKVRYINSTTYVSEVVKAYQKNKFDEFKTYFHNLDLLMIDDIQFFGDGNKEGTQIAFFELFENLIRENKQIIITSDRFPQALEGIQERLRSRFSSGISVGIDPPELEMRVGILLKKAELDNVELSEDVAFFIAKLLKANVRELEGALRKVIAYSRFHNEPLNIENSKIALRDLLQNRSGQVSIEQIQKVVADFYKIKLSDMMSTKRPRAIAVPRQIAMYLAKSLTQKSLPEIGSQFGGRDHTTVLHACRKIEDARQHDSQLQHELNLLSQILKG